MEARQYVSKKAVQPAAAGHIPALIQGINNNDNKANNVQAYKWVSEKGLKNSAIILSMSKWCVVLDNLPQGSFKWGIAIG